MKLKPLTLTVVIGTQFAVSALAADVTATNSTTEADEISTLKKEVQVLEQKVEDLEKRQTVQTNSAPPAQIEALDQKVRILERERENDQEEAAALAKTQPRLAISQNGVSF